MVSNLAGKLTREDIARLETIMEEYKTPPQNKEEDRIHHEASLRFHSKLAEYAKNHLLGFIIGFIAETLSEMTTNRRLFDYPNLQLWREGREFQLNLLNIDPGDSKKASEIMDNDHMEFAEKLMQQQEFKVERRFSDF